MGEACVAKQEGVSMFVPQQNPSSPAHRCVCVHMDLLECTDQRLGPHCLGCEASRAVRGGSSSCPTPACALPVGLEGACALAHIGTWNVAGECSKAQ